MRSPPTPPPRKSAWPCCWIFPANFPRKAAINDLFQTIMARVMEVIPCARRGAMLMRDGEKDHLLLKAYVANEEPAVSETLARRTLAERRAFIWTAGAPGGLSRSIRQLQIVNGMYAPLQWQEQVFGVICVDSPVAGDRFTEEDLQFLVSIGRYAGHGPGRTTTSGRLAPQRQTD